MSPPNDAIRRRIRVLLVDDDEETFILIRRLLGRGARLEYQVAWAAGPGAARAAFVRGEYDVCLLDYSLDSGTGFELLESVRGEIDPHKPVILLTERYDTDLDQEALEHGVADFIDKERLDPQSLRRSIRYALERARTLAELSETQERFELAVAGSRDGIWDWDLRTGSVFYSERWMRMVGQEPGEVGDSIDEWVDRVHEDDRLALREQLGAHIEGHVDELKLEYRIRHSDGHYRWMQSRARAVRGRDGRAVRIAGSQSDITEERLVRERLAHRALHDELTGLPNRTLFLDRVFHCIKRCTRDPDHLFAVLFLDLDRFKVINDSLGHAAGDTLLTEASRRLVECVRPGDSVARLGGDEFAILLDGVRSEHDAIRVVDRIQHAFQNPFVLGSRRLFVRTSVGIAFGDTRYVEAGDILRDADAAMYKAKQRGRARYEVFDTSVHAQALHRLEMESELRRGYERREFVMYFQPIVALADRALIGLEALMRWNHPGKGVLGPAEFLPLADEIGLLADMERVALQGSGDHIRRWCEATSRRGRNLTVSINLCGRNLRDPYLARTIDEWLERTGLPAEMLKVEITENTVMRDDDFVTQNLVALGKRNIRMYIDDFGTGYSSLGRLRELPVDTLKIDRSFVSAIHIDENSREIVRAIVTLARNLGLGVIAEGTESEDQLDQLRALHCDRCQGYLFSRPLPARSVDAVVERGSA